MDPSSSYMKSPSGKRFVVEDSITKVTSDGEPHEMMTIIAGLSGVFAAVVILTILIFVVACKKSNNSHECDRCSETGSQGKRPSAISDDLTDAQSKCSSTATIYDPKTERHSTPLAVIYNGTGNLRGNLNKAFEASEFSLHSACERPKKVKRTRWQDQMETCESNGAAKDSTTVNVARY